MKRRALAYTLAAAVLLGAAVFLVWNELRYSYEITVSDEQLSETLEPSKFEIVTDKPKADVSMSKAVYTARDVLNREKKVGIIITNITGLPGNAPAEMFSPGWVYAEIKLNGEWYHIGKCRVSGMGYSLYPGDSGEVTFNLPGSVSSGGPEITASSWK